MSTWLQRAKACFTQKGQEGTDKTDETPLLSVLAVPPGAIYQFPDRLSSVSSVGVWAIFEKTQLASDLIEAAMRRCDEFDDGEGERQQMRQDCLELPPAMQQDLLDHFNKKPAHFN